MRDKDGEILLYRELVLGESFFELPQNELHQALRILGGADAVYESGQHAGS
jgi:hypothetical protein